MSERAAAYYADLAAVHDIEDIPSILDGMPVPLLNPEQELSLLRPQEDLSEQIVGRYKATLLSLSEFLIAISLEEKPELQGPGLQLPFSKGSGRHLTGLIEHLLKPSKLDTGRLAGVQIQAVRPDETGIYSRSYALGMQKHDQAEIDAVVGQSVVLVTSANVLPATAVPEGYVAFMSIARAVPGPAIQCSGKQLPRSDLKQQKAQWRPPRRTAIPNGIRGMR